MDFLVDFSHAGKRLGFNSSTTHNLKDDITDGNSRGTLHKSFVAVVDRVRPKMFVAENVYGLLTMKKCQGTAHEQTEFNFEVVLNC